MLKSPVYQRWIKPNQNPLLLIVGLLFVYLGITLFYTPKKVDPIYFPVLVTRKYHIVDGHRSPDHLTMEHEYLFDPEKYSEHFFFNLNYPKDGSKTMKTLLKEVKKGDTLIVGVDKNEFAAIQNYGSNFIKDDFFDRALTTYYLYKNKKPLMYKTPGYLYNQQNGTRTMLLVTIVITIIYIFLKNTKFVKNFT